MKDYKFTLLLENIIELMENGEIMNYGKRFSKLTISAYRKLLTSFRNHSYDFNIEELDLNGVANRRERLVVTRKLILLSR